jgi:ATP-dependent DNA helicase RecG
VGRGQAKSYCILLSEHPSEESKRRLKVMTKTNDGFEISREDLALRGPGDFFGQRQHGLPALKIADLSCDMALLDEAQQAAKGWMARDPALEKPESGALRARIETLFAVKAEGLN